MFEKWFYIYLLRSMLTNRTRYFWPSMYERLCFFARGCGFLCLRGRVFLWEVVCLCVWEVVCFFERANLKSAGALSRSPLSHRPPPFYLSQHRHLQHIQPHQSHQPYPFYPYPLYSQTYLFTFLQTSNSSFSNNLSFHDFHRWAYSEKCSTKC